MKFQARRPIGLGDRLLSPGDAITEEELGEEIERLLEIGAIAEDEVPKSGKARKQDEL